MFLQVLKIEVFFFFCFVLVFFFFFFIASLIGYVGWAVWTGSPMLNCILPLCLPLDI